MSNRGRIRKVALDIQMCIYKEHINDIVKNGNLVSLRDNIYQTMAEKLDMSRKAVFLSITKNIDAILNGTNLKLLNESTDFDISSSSLLTDTTNSSINSDKTLSLSIDITSQDVFKIKIAYGLTKNRRKLIRSLEPGWTDKLVEIIWNETKTQCVWSFRRGICKQDEIYCYGHCIECLAIVETNTVSSENNILLNLNISGGNENMVHTHKRKRKITGQNKILIREKLKYRSALDVHTEMANEMIDEDGLQPGHMPDRSTLNQIKYKDSTEQFSKNDPLLSIYHLMNDKLKGIVTDIGMAPFFVFYLLPLQREWFRQENKQRYTAISIDATGSIVKPPKSSLLSKHNDKPAHIFLYNIMAKTENNKSVAVGQMLSQRHTSHFIAYWLTCWSKEAVVPNEVVTDDSAALLAAVVQSFTSLPNMRSYLEKSYMCLTKNTNPPEIYIRLDRSHFVKFLHRWKPLKNQDSRKVKLIKRILGVLIQCDDFQSAKAIIKNLFTSLLNMYDDENSPGYYSKIFLIKLCETHNILLNEQEIPNEEDVKNDCQSIFSEEFIDDDGDDNESWINTIIRGVEISSDTGKHDNLYYFTEIIDDLKKLLIRLPLWSNVMMRHYNSPYRVSTSSDCESNFKSLKKLVIKQKSIRVDKFLISHINFINGSIKIGLSNKPKLENNEIDIIQPIEFLNEESYNSVNEPMIIIEQCQEIKKPKLETQYENDENNQENWRNKNKEISKPKQNKRRALSSILNTCNFELISNQLPVLENGTVFRNKKKTTQITNTCGFDSVFSILQSIYVDIESIKLEIDTKTNLDFFKLLKNVDPKKIDRQFYCKRFNILEAIVVKPISNFSNGLTVIDAEMNISTMITKLFTNSNLNSLILKKKCGNCEWYRHIPYMFIPLNIETIEAKSIYNLPEAIVDLTKNIEKCNCGSEIISEVEYKKFVIVDVQKKPQCNEVINIDEIPKELILNGQMYCLKGFIDFKEMMKSGHYVGCVIRPHNIWEVYDDLKRTVGQLAINVRPHILFYVRQ